MARPEIEEIRELPLFADMRDESFEALTRGAYVQNFPPLIELIREGDPADFLHIIIEGNVELFAEWNNRETTMATVRPISTFILAATIKDGPYLMSARTLEKSRIVLLPSVDVRTVFENDAKFAKSIILELAQCYRGVVKSSKNLKLRTSVERLANYLIRQHGYQSHPETFQLQVDKKRLAALLGMTPENLSRAFKTLGNYGVVVDGAQIKISNSQDLHQFAKPSKLIDDYSC